MQGVEKVGIEELPDDRGPTAKPTSRPCAASFARASTAAGSPSTKWNVVSESVNDGRSWCVMTNTGV